MSSTGDKTASAKGVAVGVEREVDYDDVDDVIGIASELAELEEDRLSVEDLVEVARDLEIPEKHVAPAVEELRRRRQAMLAEEARRRSRRRVLIAAGIVIAVILVIWAFIGQASLSGALADVRQQQAQVNNVVERQVATERIWSGQSGSDALAELAGAENRVRVERRRYDEAAAAYNAEAGAFPGSLWATLFGYPDRLPLSNEVTRW